MSIEVEIRPGKTILVDLRLLEPGWLRGVIFSCTNMTFQECLTKKLFGLPPVHHIYVQSIEPGMPLFLFNRSTRLLHGIFGAASSGKTKIDPHFGWTKDDPLLTPYPAQVRIRVLKDCRPLPEEEFKSVIADYYYTETEFHFELDQNQVSRLISLFSTQEVATAASLSGEAQASENVNMIHNEVDGSHKEKMALVENIKKGCFTTLDLQFIIAEMQELKKAFKEKKFKTSDQLQQNQQNLLQELKGLLEETIKTISDGRLQPSELKQLPEVQQLQDCRTGLEASSSIEHLVDPDGLIYLVGGYDGISWLNILDSYSPSEDTIKSGNKMPFAARAYSSAAALNGEIYVIGGGYPGYAGSESWYADTLKFNPTSSSWTVLPCLDKNRGCLAATAWNGKIFAVGGANEDTWFSDMYVLDVHAGNWMYSSQMREKRSQHAAVELNGIIYAAGGFSGTMFLSSVEQFDPREGSWRRNGDMTYGRACHSLVVLNEKLYAIGGFDDSEAMVSVEVFDPRCGLWTVDKPMIRPAGAMSVAVLGDSIYAIGGATNGIDAIEKIERYQEDVGWQLTNLKGVSRRGFASAVVI